MEVATIVFRLLATSQIILFMIQILFSANHLRVRIVGVLLSLGCIGYLVLPLAQEYIMPIQHITVLWFLPCIVPSLLLLFVWFIFEEHCRFPPWILVITGASILGSVWYVYLDVQLPDTPAWFQIFKLSIVLIALYVVWRGHDQDLVMLRSRFRYIFIAAMSGIIFISFAAEVITGFDTPDGLDALTAGADFLLLLTFNYFFLKLNPDALLMSITESVSVTEKSSDPLITQLLERMRNERLYADHDIRVGGLAALLNVPEYQLRSKINQQLGYRNFNQFVNHYRIEEAGIKLKEDTRTPVLSIALDVGFRSISSFNTAFQQHFGVSPTKYRAEALSET